MSISVLQFLKEASEPKQEPKPSTLKRVGKGVAGLGTAGLLTAGGLYAAGRGEGRGVKDAIVFGGRRAGSAMGAGAGKVKAKAQEVGQSVAARVRKPEAAAQA